MTLGALLFDLDGTLVDSVPDLAQALDATLTEGGLPRAGEARTRDWVGNGARKLVERALTWATGEAPAEPDLDAALQRFLHHYTDCCSDLTRPYPGVPEFLERVKDSWHLAIVTNKPERFIRPILEATGLAPAFTVCVGGDTLPVRKPDPAPVHHALKQLGTPTGDALMIGDSVTDIRAARQAGIPVIAVPYGYNHGQPVEEAGADHVVQRLDDLHTAQLKELLNHKALEGS
ncbi:MAG: phosphoglycolate phosphatase [Gammaproteobacteria bacterium]|nr:MAG: phosphoglycolate phosphatase [Gammaproteobacteria bacterium]